MKKNFKTIMCLLLIFALSFSFNLSSFAKESKNSDVGTIKTSYQSVGIGNRIGRGEAFGKGIVRVYITLDQNYPNGILIRAGAAGNDTPYSCSVVYPDNTVRVLCSAELNNLHANGDCTDYFYISYGDSGTYEFIFSMEDTTKTTGCLAWIYEAV